MYHRGRQIVRDAMIHTEEIAGKVEGKKKWEISKIRDKFIDVVHSQMMREEAPKVISSTSIMPILYVRLGKLPPRGITRVVRYYGKIIVGKEGRKDVWNVTWKGKYLFP